MSGRMQNRVTLVTGGTGQLGRHVVTRCLDEGARVHVPVFDPGEADSLREHLGDRHDRATLHLEGDLTDAARVDGIMSDIRQAEGRSVEILLNLAGGFEMSAVEETRPEAWHRLWQMNATTAFLVSRAAVGPMKEAGWGRIVSVSAQPALEGGRAGVGAYAAAKSAVLTVTRTLALEGRERGVTANALVPTVIDTPQNREAMPGADTSRWLPPDEVAGVIAFLASDEARIVNGAAVTLDLG
jgi:NAD(P)-dependent dehydrogenase (short-subunit alcohol dehydrogenase family)